MAVLRACTPFGRVRLASNTTKSKMSKKRARLHWYSAKAACKTSRSSRNQLAELRAVLINLDRRPDRFTECSAKLNLHCPWLHYERFAATDGSKDAIGEDLVTSSWNTGMNVHYQKLRATRKGWDDLDSYVVKDLKHSVGERGCSLSHIRAWRHCIEHAGETNTPLLVLEDDATPIEGFTKILARALKALPTDAHVLYLGYSQAAPWRRVVSADLVESEYVWTTVGYIIWPTGARILLNRLPVDQPVDNFMAAACATGGLKAYCVRPKIILQAEAWNVSSDVGHSDEVDSDVKHSDSLYPGLPGDALLADGGVFYGLGSDSSDESDDSMNP